MAVLTRCQGADKEAGTCVGNVRDTTHHLSRRQEVLVICPTALLSTLFQQLTTIITPFLYSQACYYLKVTEVKVRNPQNIGFFNLQCVISSYEAGQNFLSGLGFHLCAV